MTPIPAPLTETEESALKARIDNLEITVDGLERELDGTEMQVEGLHQAVKGLKIQVRASHQEATRLRKLVDIVLASNKELREENQSLRLHKEAATQKSAQKDEEIARLQALVAALRKGDPTSLTG